MLPIGTTFGRFRRPAGDLSDEPGKEVEMKTEGAETTDLNKTVIKSLGWTCRDAEGVSGATILGNGEVALIIDVQRVFQLAKKEEEALVGCRTRGIAEQPISSAKS